MVIHSILPHLSTDLQGIRGGITHLSAIHYLISCPMESSKLYDSSDLRILSLCRSAMAPPAVQPWSYTPHPQVVSGLLAKDGSGCAAACSLLVTCLMSSSGCCWDLLSFCCDLLRQEAPSTHIMNQGTHHFAHGIPQQSSMWKQTVLTPQLLHFFIAGSLDAVNLHLSSLQQNAIQSVLECAFNLRLLPPLLCAGYAATHAGHCFTIVCTPLMSCCPL